MFIQTEATPDPATLKFLPGCPVMEKGTADFTDANDARRSPLATALFGVEGITRPSVCRGRLLWPRIPWLALTVFSPTARLRED